MQAQLSQHGTQRHRGGQIVPVNTEFAIRLEDRPGMLAHVCRALADRGVNILAFQSSPYERDGQSVLRLVVDNPTSARAALDDERLTHTEAQIAQVRLAHRPGQLARAAAWLSKANINIDHVYCGVEPHTNFALLILGVADAGRAVRILEETAPGGAGA